MTRFALAALGLLRLAVPMLSGLLLLSFTGGPSYASQPPALLAPGSAPAPAVFQIISPAATVLDTRHYMAKVELTCSGMACLRDLPTISAKRRLNITQVSCSLLGTLGSTASGGYIELQRADNWPLLDQYLPVNNSVPDERIGSIHTLSDAVDMQILPGQHARIGVFAASGTARFATCSVSGSLELLK